jgi:hypothetical protein
MKNYYCTFLIYFLCIHISYGQVSQIEEQIVLEKSTSNTSNSQSVIDSESSSAVDNLILLDSFLFLVEATTFLFVEGQHYVMENKEDHPHLFSIEASVLFGQDFENLSTLTRPKARVNYGLFYSDLQFSHINDFSGRLTSWDWQMLGVQLPLSIVDLRGALGFIHIPEFNVSYFESSAGLGVNLSSIKTVLSLNYRASSRTSIGSRYREMFDFRVDYQLYQNKRMRISPALGFSRERYFGSTHFSFLKAGVVFRWY